MQRFRLHRSPPLLVSLAALLGLAATSAPDLTIISPSPISSIAATPTVARETARWRSAEGGPEARRPGAKI